MKRYLCFVLMYFIVPIRPTNAGARTTGLGFSRAATNHRKLGVQKADAPKQSVGLVDHEFGGLTFEEYVEDVIRTLSRREGIPTDDLVWEGVRRDFKDFHTEESSQNVAQFAASKVIRSVPKDIGVDDKTWKAEMRRAKDDGEMENEENCQAHLLQYDSSINTIKVFLDSASCVEAEESRFELSFPESFIRRETKNSLCFTFRSREDYDTVYEYYRAQITLNGGIADSLNGVSGWNSDDEEDDGEIVEMPDPTEYRNEAGTIDDSEGAEDVEGPLDAGEFEDYVERIVRKLQDRERIPAEDEIWLGVRQDFIDFHFQDQEKARADMAAYFNKKYQHVKSKARTKTNSEGKNEKGTPYFTLVSQGLVVVLILAAAVLLALILLCMKQSRQRGVKSNAILPITVHDTLEWAGAEKSANDAFLHPHLHRIRLSMPHGHHQDARPTSAIAEALKTRYIMVTPCPPTQITHKLEMIDD